MAVTPAQDLSEDPGTGLLRRKDAVEAMVVEQRYQVGRVTVFLKLEEENKVEEIAEGVLQRGRMEEVEMEVKKEMVEAKKGMVGDERQLVEENENLVEDKTGQRMEEAKQRVEELEDVLTLFSRPVLMSALGLIPRCLLPVWQDAPRGARMSNLTCKLQQTSYRPFLPKFYSD